MNDPYELLTTHAVHWAENAGRPLDATLLSTVLNLRDTHDRTPGTSWPAGSADHLITVRWPEHRAPGGAPDHRAPGGAASDTGALVDTLATFWQFLSATGRLAPGSADPPDLATEARRAQESMPAGRADRAHRTRPAAAGRTKGVTPSGDRIDREPGDTAAGATVADIDVQAALPIQDPAEVLAVVARSTYRHRLDGLLDAIGERGREVTSAGWLRPKFAAEIIAALEIDEWVERVLGSPPSPWRSAGDHLGLGLLFSPAKDVGLLDYRGNRVVHVPRPMQDDPAARHAHEIALLNRLHHHTHRLFLGDPLPGIVLGVQTDRLKTRADIESWWLQAPENMFGDLEQFGAAAKSMRKTSIRWLGSALLFWEEAGMLVDRPDGVQVTPLGIEFTRLLLDPARRAGDA